MKREESDDRDRDQVLRRARPPEGHIRPVGWNPSHEPRGAGSLGTGKPLEVTSERKGRRYRGSALLLRIGGEWANVQGARGSKQDPT